MPLVGWPNKALHSLSKRRICKVVQFRNWSIVLVAYALFVREREGEREREGKVERERDRENERE